MLPISVQNNILSLLKTVTSKSSLISARKNLTEGYREPKGIKVGFSNEEEAISYVATRMPATFEAVTTVLNQVPLEEITSVLDLGSGPGTAALAAALRWVQCPHFHLIEGNSFMKGLSEKLLENIPEIAHQNFSFHSDNILNLSDVDTYDLVILSYVLTELSSKEQEALLLKAWEKLKKGLVLVVPGTPQAYKQLMIIRDLLIHKGAFIVAPCPHHKPCPLTGDDWCHFSTRLARPAFHKEIKDVALGYEDEKYSYLVALKEPTERIGARVIKRPLKRSGHVILDLCATDGLYRQTVSKKDKDYKRATKIVWGDSFGKVI